MGVSGCYHNRASNNIDFVRIYSLFSVDILCGVRIDCILFHIATDGMVPLLHVLGCLFADFVCGAKCRFGRWRRYECSKWCILGTGDVRTIPFVFRFLRIVRCHSNLSAMDHLSVVHSIWFRRHRVGDILIWSWEIEVSSNLLPFPFAGNDIGRTRYDRCQFHTRHCCIDHHIPGAQSVRIRILELEIAIGPIGERNILFFSIRFFFSIFSCIQFSIKYLSVKRERRKSYKFIISF